MIIIIICHLILLFNITLIINFGTNYYLIFRLKTKSIKTTLKISKIQKSLLSHKLIPLSF